MSVLVVITHESDAAALTRWGHLFARCEERNLNVLVALQVADAERLAGIGREFWHAPVLVRLHSEYIVEGSREMEAGFSSGASP